MQTTAGKMPALPVSTGFFGRSLFGRSLKSGRPTAFPSLPFGDAGDYLLQGSEGGGDVLEEGGAGYYRAEAAVCAEGLHEALHGASNRGNEREFWKISAITCRVPCDERPVFNFRMGSDIEIRQG